MQISVRDAEVNERMRERGVAGHLQGGGRQGLIGRWRSFVEKVEKGYELGLDGYCNEFDVGGIIEHCGLANDPDVAALDERFRAHLIDPGRRVWLSDYANAFWIYGYPRNAPEEFAHDLERA